MTNKTDGNIVPDEIASEILEPWRTGKVIRLKRKPPMMNQPPPPPPGLPEPIEPITFVAKEDRGSISERWLCVMMIVCVVVMVVVLLRLAGVI